jgi:hypothetical protein
VDDRPAAVADPLASSSLQAAEESLIQDEIKARALAQQLGTTLAPEPATTFANQVDPRLRLRIVFACHPWAVDGGFQGDRTWKLMGKGDHNRSLTEC